ncbi:MAG: type II secretion system F family protein [Acidimicrobiia bacterium]
MTLLVAGLAGTAVWLVSNRQRILRSGVVTGALLAPVPAMAGAAAMGLLRARRRLHIRRTIVRDAAADVGLLAELTGLGLSAGLGLSQALSAARPFVHPRLAEEVDGVLRRAAHGGLAAALAGASGHGRRLYLLAARSVVTGAPLASAMDAFVAEAAAEERSAQLEAARRLPVRLMLPLALLILPGFVLLTVGPAVLAALERFALPQ